MILPLLYSIIGLIALLYILALLIEWKSIKEDLPEMTLEDIALITDSIERTARKSAYSVRRLWRGAQEYGSGKIRSLFVKLFPSAEHALKERDLLTGLSSGPSSYFLLELSQFRSKEKIRRKQKSVQE